MKRQKIDFYFAATMNDDYLYKQPIHSTACIFGCMLCSEYCLTKSSNEIHKYVRSISPHAMEWNKDSYISELGDA